MKYSEIVDTIADSNIAAWLLASVQIKLCPASIGLKILRVFVL